MFRYLPLFALLLPLSSLQAEVREWKSSDGSRTFKGEYVSREKNEVTIKREDGNQLTFPIDKLHQKDREWIKLNFPTEPAPPEKPTAFGNLVFGDTRDEVFSKLEESMLVEALPTQGVFGGIEITDSLKTKQQLGGLDCYISFGWSDAGRLERIDMKTASLPKSQYQSRLKAAWEECVQLLNTLHGKPVQKSPFPDPNTIEPGMAVGTCIWKIAEGGGAMVGVRCENEEYGILIRFTKNEMDAENPAGSKPGI